MVKKSEWNDQQIEDLLSQMPKIKDERDPQDIYQNIVVKMNKKRQRVWMMPAVATVGAALLLFILVPGLLDGNSSQENALDHADQPSSEIAMLEDTMNEEKVEQKTKMDEEVTPFSADAEPETTSEMGIRSVGIEDSATAIYEEDLADKYVLTYAIPDPNVMMSVPVSVLVSKEEDKSKFELFTENMANLKEEEWGLRDYFPLNADLTFDEESNVLTVDVPIDHSYGKGSATEVIFNDTLSYMMTTLDIEKINLLTAGNPGVELGNFGLIEEFVPKEQLGNHAYYFYYPNDSTSKPFIVPYGEKLKSINEAFSAMKENQDKANLVASIPAEISLETDEDPAEKKLTIHFGEGSIINNDESTLHTIEAILLTAKDFNYQTVKLENANIDIVGKFDLNNEIKVPIAANKRSLPQ